MRRDALKKQAVNLSRRYIDPAGISYLVISLDDIRTIAMQNDIAIRRVEIGCLKSNIVPRRYLRNIGTIGIEGQIKLLSSTAAVIGAGGLGGTIVELLARCGIGHLSIIDRGKFIENNLNRQILSNESNLGKYKAKIAIGRVKEINSAVEVTAYCRAMTPQNIVRLIKGANVVLDGLDNLPARLAVADACSKLKIPFIHGAIAGFNGQLMTVMPGDRGLSSFYGPLTADNTYGIEAVTGNPPATPAVVAAWEVQEAIKLLTGIGETIRNRLLMLDFLEGTCEELPLQ